jgi:hypothetical protein
VAPRRVVEIEVAADGEESVYVFLLCLPEGIGAGMGGILWLGIAPEQIRAACALQRVPRARWPQVAEDVSDMGRAVARAQNRRAAERAKNA